MRKPHTYFDRPRGLTQEPVYIYLPQGTRTLDLEVWDSHNRKRVELFRGCGEKGLIPSREVDISRRGTHRIAIEPGEDGNLAKIGGKRLCFSRVVFGPPIFGPKARRNFSSRGRLPRRMAWSFLNRSEK